MIRAKPFYFLILFTIFIFTSSFNIRPEPGMLTQGYGIVSSKDLTDSISNVTAECVFFSEDCPTNYWMCLYVDHHSLHCKEVGTLDDGRPAFSSVLTIESDGEEHEFRTRRPWWREACAEYLTEWNQLLDDESPVCFLAQLLSRTDGEDNRLRTYQWQLDKMKSQKYHWSYFDEVQ